MNKIVIKIESVSIKIELFDEPVCENLLSILPFSSLVNTWGEEIYFEIPSELPSDNKTLDVVAGDVAYWPEGRCLCVFFGRTPLSKWSDKPVPASEVVVIGKVSEGLKSLRSVEEGERVTVDRTR
jgi:hypothetical protein